MGEVAKQMCMQIGCAGAMVTRKQDKHYDILASAGFELPAPFNVELPFEYSICQHTVAMDYPLLIEDTVFHPLLHDCKAFEEFGITAYLGAPVRGADGKAIGAVSAIEFRRRRWTPQDIAFIAHAAQQAEGLVRV